MVDLYMKSCSQGPKGGVYPSLAELASVTETWSGKDMTVAPTKPPVYRAIASDPEFEPSSVACARTGQTRSANRVAVSANARFLCIALHRTRATTSSGV